MPISHRKKALSFSALALSLLVSLAFLLGTSASPAAQRLDLSLNTAAVRCSNATDVAVAFEVAVVQTQQTPPDYSGIKGFGFTPPVNVIDIRTLRDTLQARLGQLNAKAQAVIDGTCQDDPTASIIDANGKTKKLAVIDGHQPMTPVSGSQSNDDPRTVPVTIGTAHDATRTNTWSELDDLYGNESWYTKCANTHLGMSWERDVPKYVSTENGHDNRFIVAINVDASLTDEQIREQAAADGNPKTGALKVVRTGSIINTRHFKQNRCDEFIHTKSQIRVSLGKVVLDNKGAFKELKTDQGIFVDCHNMWRLPKSGPVPTPTPTPSTPGVTPPTKTPPTKTTPPTKPPEKCVPPAHENNNGTCIVSKKASDGAGNNNQVSEQNKGIAPPAGHTKPRPKDPPKTYKPLAPPKDPDPKPTKTRTQPPPPPPEAPKPENPGTQAPCAPGIPSC